ncbi:hypothetical protein RJ639_028612 [Escallonia herrerae]|uniref:Syringolide-induced protein 14-1-1 n=1 Tax=Escallonia herrerae TaxID=1293975 RepID=A0AA88XAY2_9ASTE|nr:hypothetical protein RJ639_028612 [Escallonia herrerae]
MEKPAKTTKSKLLKFLPKATSAVSFQNPPFSPNREKRSENAKIGKTHFRKGFSGPIISLIPAEARRKPRNSTFIAQEPTSPKISCMGQIKHKKKIQKNVTLPRNFTHYPAPALPESRREPETVKPVASSPERKNKKKSSIRSIFKSSKPAGGRKSDSSAHDLKPPLPDRAPSLSQMTRFASGRDAFANFDWTAQIAPDPREFFSDDEEIGGSSDDGEYEEPIIPFSAPLTAGGGNKGVALEPRKEINLWKRRTMTQPKPLQLHTMV